MSIGHVCIVATLCITTLLSASSPSISFEKSALKMYIITRLSRAVDLLEHIHKQKIFPKLCTKQAQEKCTIFNGNTIFKNESIRECAQEIEQKKSLQPFVTLWSEIKKKRHEVSVELLHEYSRLILEIYKVIFTACSPLFQIAFHKSMIWQAIAMLEGNFATLHAFEMLDLIDKITEQIPKLLEKYELTNTKLTWKAWITKYWWLPPIAAAAITLKAILLYQIAVGKQKLPQLKRAFNFLKQNKKTKRTT